MSRWIVTALLGATLALDAQTVSVRSGNGSISGTDTSVHFLPGPSTGAFGHVLSASDFSAAQTGPAAFIVTPNPLWISSLTADESAKWIGANANAGCCSGNTALYAVSFQVAGAFTSATLELFYAVDDAIGDGLNTGIYLNGRVACGGAFAIGFSQQHLASCDVSSFLRVGTNWLYIEDGNVEGPAGLLFSATITTVASVTTNPQPVIASLSPATAGVGSVPEILTIAGSGFITSSSVTFNGVLHSASLINSNQITIGLTASDLSTAGNFQVAVTNAPPGGGTSNSSTFAVSSVVPSIAIGGVVNAASFASGLVAPGGLAALFGGFLLKWHRTGWRDTLAGQPCRSLNCVREFSGTHRFCVGTAS